MPPRRAWATPEEAARRAAALFGPAWGTVRAVRGSQALAAMFAPLGGRGQVHDLLLRADGLLARAERLDARAQHTDPDFGGFMAAPLPLAKLRAELAQVVTRARPAKPPVTPGQPWRTVAQRRAALVRAVLAASPGATRSGAAWAYLGIALGIEGECKSADAFHERSAAWAKDLRRITNSPAGNPRSAR